MEDQRKQLAAARARRARRAHPAAAGHARRPGGQPRADRDQALRRRRGGAAPAGEARRRRIKDVPGLVDSSTARWPARRSGWSSSIRWRRAALGLTADAVSAQLSAALLGAVATPMPEHDRLIPVRVRWPDARALRRRVLERVRLRRRAARWCRSCGRAARRPLHRRRRSSRRTCASWWRSPRGWRAATSAPRSAEVEERLAGLALPRGYTVEIGGQRLSQQRASRSFGQAPRRRRWPWCC